jgi:hypothetical protein
MTALAFLQFQRLKQASGEKMNRPAAAATNPAGDPTGNPSRARPAAANHMPALPTIHQR